MILTVPLSLLFSIWFNGTSYQHFKDTKVYQTAIVCGGVVALSVIGALIGLKIAKELQAAGKLRPNDYE